MPGARYICFWFAMVGTTLMLQGCWEEEDRFTLLGSGGCRTEDGNHGAFTSVSGVSLEQCKAQCSDANGSCAAIEYIAENGNCEVHSERIANYEDKEGVACYISR